MGGAGIPNQPPPTSSSSSSSSSIFLLLSTIFLLLSTIQQQIFLPPGHHWEEGGYEKGWWSAMVIFDGLRRRWWKIAMACPWSGLWAWARSGALIRPKQNYPQKSRVLTRYVLLAAIVRASGTTGRRGGVGGGGREGASGVSRKKAGHGIGEGRWGLEDDERGFSMGREKEVGGEEKENPAAGDGGAVAREKMICHCVGRTRGRGRRKKKG